MERVEKVFGLINMSRDLKRALIKFHAFTGNDYIPSFVKDEKQAGFNTKGKM